VDPSCQWRIQLPDTYLFNLTSDQTVNCTYHLSTLSHHILGYRGCQRYICMFLNENGHQFLCSSTAHRACRISRWGEKNWAMPTRSVKPPANYKIYRRLMVFRLYTAPWPGFCCFREKLRVHATGYQLSTAECTLSTMECTLSANHRSICRPTLYCLSLVKLASLTPIVVKLHNGASEWDSSLDAVLFHE
jgi:hypothetical protein